MIALIDYGAGNLRSISNAFGTLGAGVETVSEPESLEGASAIILPGVGHFGNAMERLTDFGDVLEERIADGVPFLGLCLGLQVLMEGSEESPGIRGLGILKGKCKRFPESVKVPHMGWNDVKIVKDNPMLGGVDDRSRFYFVHSYYVIPKNNDVTIATTDYGVEFPSVIGRDNVMATQFHPEKSGVYGFRILKNFLKLV